ncbi:MAG: hypothetical protein B7733_09955 [Myxococcales bacterium FL481]|nr:MAG: hypothetical protein B7733_09955 [Myxococcales bacterium FL481]
MIPRSGVGSPRLSPASRGKPRGLPMPKLYISIALRPDRRPAGTRCASGESGPRETPADRRTSGGRLKRRAHEHGSNLWPRHHATAASRGVPVGYQPRESTSPSTRTPSMPTPRSFGLLLPLMTSLLASCADDSAMGSDEAELLPHPGLDEFPPPPEDTAQDLPPWSPPPTNPSTGDTDEPSDEPTSSSGDTANPETTGAEHTSDDSGTGDDPTGDTEADTEAEESDSGDGDDTAATGDQTDDGGDTGATDGGEPTGTGDGDDDDDPAPPSRVMIVVLEGLRPEYVTPATMPNLWGLQRRGVAFRSHTTVFPANSHVAAASLATGTYPDKHGVLGARMFLPGVSGRDARNSSFTTQAPFELRDYGVMRAVDADRRLEQGLLRQPTLFDVAAEAARDTVVVGRSGPATLLRYELDDHAVFVDEDVAWPLSFAFSLQLANGNRLPPNTGFLLPSMSGYEDPFVVQSAGPAVLAPLIPPPYLRPDVLPTYDARTHVLSGLSPVNSPADVIVLNPASDRLTDLGTTVGHGAGTADPGRELFASTRRAGSDFCQEAFELAVSRTSPALALLWIDEPGHTARHTGPGSQSAWNMAREADARLGALLAWLANEGLTDEVDLVVTSDHGFSTVAGDAAYFDRYASTPLSFDVVPGDSANGEPAAVSPRADALVTRAPAPTGLPIDGETRVAWLLRGAGFEHVYDGDATGAFPDRPGCTHTAMAETVRKAAGLGAELCLPTGLDADAVPYPPYDSQLAHEETIVVAENEGTALIYLPHADPSFAQLVARALLGRLEVGAVFAADDLALIPGVLPLSAIRLDSADDDTPEFVVALASTDDAIAGYPHRVQVGPARPGGHWFETCAPDEEDSCREGLTCLPSRHMPGNAAETPEFRCIACPWVDIDDNPNGLTDSERLATVGREVCRFVGDDAQWQASWGQGPGAWPRALAEGEACEAEHLCEAGLSCRPFVPSGLATVGVCLESGAPWPTTPLPAETSPLLTGTSYSSMRNARGTAGGLAPAEMRTVLVMAGPSFREDVEVMLPTSVVDIAPTVAKLLQLEFPHADGRPLVEALEASAVVADDYAVSEPETIFASTTAVALSLYEPTSAVSDADHRITQDGTYRTQIEVVSVSLDGRRYTYPVAGRGVRSAP